MMVANDSKSNLVCPPLDFIPTKENEWWECTEPKKKAKPTKALFFGPLALPGVTGKPPCKTQELLSTSAVDFSVTHGTLSSRELNFLNDKIPSRTMYPIFFIYLFFH